MAKKPRVPWSSDAQLAGRFSKLSSIVQQSLHITRPRRQQRQSFFKATAARFSHVLVRRRFHDQTTQFAAQRIGHCMNGAFFTSRAPRDHLSPKTPQLVTPSALTSESARWAQVKRNKTDAAFSHQTRAYAFFFLSESTSFRIFLHEIGRLQKRSSPQMMSAL